VASTAETVESLNSPYVGLTPRFLLHVWPGWPAAMIPGIVWPLKADKG
jgi:hypothetical protein